MPDSTSLSNKRQRLEIDPTAAPVTGDGFIQDADAGDSGADDDDDDDKPKTDKKAGRRKIKIEFIQDKSRRHITFSKRKAGIMKKAYELSTLTGTQVLLLVVSETGLVYTFTTAKLQPLVTQPEGKNLIQACLNAPHGQLPSSMPVGAPLGRSSAMSGVPPHSPSQPAPPPNVPGGLAIGGKDDDGNDDGESVPPPPSADAESSDRGGRKRRRASSTTTAPNARSSASGTSASSGPPPPPPPPPSSSASSAPTSQQQPPPPPPPSGTGATSPHNRSQMLPGGLSIPGGPQQGQQMQPQSPSYPPYAPPNAADPSAGIYGGYGGQPQPPPQGSPYGYPPQAVPAGHEQQQSGMPWGGGVQQGNHYQRR